MTLYTRHQLLLVLLLAGAAGGGLAVDHWRRASPELAERLEMLDRAERPPAPVAARRPARLAADSDRAVPAARERTETPVDVNRASEVELTALPGIGPALAARIVAARPFTGIDELRRVRGLRRATLERLRPLVTAATAASPVE